MRIVLVAEGTRGDVFPLLRLGRGLRGRGHEVRLAASPDFADDAARAGLEFAAVGAPIRAYLAERAGAMHGGLREVMRESRDWLREAIPAQFEALPEACAGADRVLAGGIAFAASSVAEHCGAAYRYLVYCPALFASAEYAPYPVRLQHLPRFANRWLWRGLLALQERELRPLLGAGRDSLGLPPLANAYRSVLGERPLLAADGELAPLPGDLWLPVDRVPCLHAAEPGGEPLPEKLEAFLAAGEPPVYVGFGSMPDPDPARTTRLVVEAAERVDLRVVLGSGWAELGAGSLPERVLPVGALDHAALFPRMAALVHHGGAGTTTTAARAGVPQLVVPHLMDQFWWGEQVYRQGLGPPPLPRSRLSAERLAHALAALRDAEWVAERAAALGARLRAAASLEPALDAALA